MRLNLTSKTFLTLVATTLVILALSAVAVRWSFQRGLMDYVNEARGRRVATLATTLAEVYREEGSFDLLRGNPRRLQRLMMIGSQPGDSQRPRPGFGTGPHREGHQRSGRGAFDPVASARGITLLDAQGDIIIGPPGQPPPDDRIPVIVDGEQVGELAVAPLRALSSNLDRDFAARQGRWLLGIFAASLLVAAAVAWWFSRQLTRPIRQLAGGARALTGGDYGRMVELTQRDELGQLAQDFNRLSQQLKDDREHRQRLMADISHELRTPLAALRGQLSALRDGVREPTPEHLAALDAQITRLVSLVDDIYDLSLADSGALPFDMAALDLSALVERVAALFATRFEEQGLNLELALTSPAQIQGDAQRLEQLVGNLLENSLRYTDAGGAVRVETVVAGGQVVLTIDDSEPGVGDEALPHLFERLYRVDKSRSRASGGAGLGLALVQNIAAAHGGDVGATHSELGGLQIAIRFEATDDH